MAEWDLSTARTSLRTLLADKDSDKFEFKVPIYPTPDGFTTTFSLGRTNLVAGTVTVYQDGTALVATAVTSDLVKGTATLSTAPKPECSLLASFFFQWFTDAQLDEFFGASHQLFGFDEAAGVAPVNLRTVILDFASYHAYMFMAAQTAEELVVSAGGYTAHQGRSNPNWLKLAQTTLEKAQAKLKIYTDSLVANASPALAFTKYRLPNWQGL